MGEVELGEQEIFHHQIKRCSCPLWPHHLARLGLQQLPLIPTSHPPGKPLSEVMVLGPWGTQGLLPTNTFAPGWQGVLPSD